MLDAKQPINTEEQEIKLLEEWLPKTGGEFRAYIKGALKALLYVQEGQYAKMPENLKKGVMCNVRS